MVGIFSRLSSKSFHRRAQSIVLDGREVLPSASEATASVIAQAAAPVALAIAPHGIEISTKFKPVERPFDLLDNNQPIQCPLPEPSILNDGRIWKERVSSVARRRRDMLDETQEEADNLPKTTSAPF